MICTVDLVREIKTGFATTPLLDLLVLPVEPIIIPLHSRDVL